MPRAVNLLRESLHYRRAAFDAGLRAAGYEPVVHLPVPEPDDVLVIWNRYSRFAAEADRFEAAGARVLVVENGYLGKSWRGGEWFSLAVGHHAGAGSTPYGGPGRWDAWGVELKPWRQAGGETVILGQRGIGEPGIASPDHWAERAQRQVGGRIRSHPGKDASSMVPLEEDLASASRVVTWASSAALHAIRLGIPVFYDMPKWIGARACRPLAQWGLVHPNRDDDCRLGMFRRLAWALWSLEEVSDGRAIARVLAR